MRPLLSKSGRGWAPRERRTFKCSLLPFFNLPFSSFSLPPNFPEVFLVKLAFVLFSLTCPHIFRNRLVTDRISAVRYLKRSRYLCLWQSYSSGGARWCGGKDMSICVESGILNVSLMPKLNLDWFADSFCGLSSSTKKAYCSYNYYA